MRPLVIDENAKAAIAAVCEYAEANKINIAGMQARVEYPDAFSPVGDDDNHVCNLFRGYKCAFSVEEHPMGWTKHLSVSVGPEPGVLPHIEAVKAIMVEFGIHKTLEECHVYIEEGEVKSVNIICPI